jgi:hypothetical protein
MHPARLAPLAHQLKSGLACAQVAPDTASSRRRRELLGTLLWRKAASGAFDLELLHHWLDAGLRRRRDRRLFGLDGPAPPWRRPPHPRDPLEFSSLPRPRVARCPEPEDEDEAHDLGGRLSCGG